MTTKTPAWKNVKISAVFAVAGALAVNAAIGWAIVHSPDGARMLALHSTPRNHRMVANLGSLPAINVCAPRART